MSENDIDWAERRRFSKSGARPPYWPAGVSGISMDGLSLIGIDDQNRLYWDGNRLATLTLTRWQKLGAIAVTASAVIGAAAAVISATASPSGRFQVSDVGGQILRVDTTTGEARECTLNDERKVVCMAVFNRDGIFAPAHSSARP